MKRTGQQTLSSFLGNILILIVQKHQSANNKRHKRHPSGLYSSPVTPIYFQIVAPTIHDQMYDGISFASSPDPPNECIIQTASPPSLVPYVPPAPRTGTTPTALHWSCDYLPPFPLLHRPEQWAHCTRGMRSHPSLASLYCFWSAKVSKIIPHTTGISW